jgi:hypothetical protein
MRFCALPIFLSTFMLVSSAFAQDPSASPSWPPPTNGSGANPQRGGRGMMGMGSGMGIAGGRGVMGTVTEVTAGHFMIKTEDGRALTVHYSVNTRILKQPPGSRGPGMRRGRGQRGEQRDAQSRDGGFGAGGAFPETIKAAEIKVGDAIAASGEMDQAAKSIGAVGIILLDPETAKQLEEMRANFGKTWIQGKVTGIDGVKVTVMSAVDNAAHSFVADENTTFRKRREPITLSDIAIGDMLRADGGVKDGLFTASSVIVMGMPPGGMPGGPPNMPSPQ